MKQHVTVVAALNIGFGILKLFAAAVALLAIVGGGLISGDSEAIFITGIVGPAVALFLALLALPGIVGGLGLLKGKNWARMLVIILAILDLIDFPIGTLISLYTLWVLLNKETSDLFEDGFKTEKQVAFG